MSALIIKTVEEKIEEIGRTISYLQAEVERQAASIIEHETDRAELSAELEKLKGKK